jgi:hypothetical protein
VTLSTVMRSRACWPIRLSVIRVAAVGDSVLIRIPYFTPSRLRTFMKPTTPILAAP